MTDREPTRRDLLALAGGTVMSGLAGCLGDAGPGDDGEDSTPVTTPTPSAVPERIDLETVVDGVEAPLDIVFSPADDRRYVATQPGVIHVHEDDGLREEPLLDLRDDVVTGYEMGLLGVALHPAFPDDRRLFVRYSAPPRGGTPGEYDHTFVLAEFAVNEDGTRADPDSERAVLEIPQPQGNHNSGAVAFGPDGYLYVGTGDGGAANDTGLGHPDGWYDRNEGGNGQDTSDHLLGGILRIDVDGREGDRGYAIPPDNPLVDREGHRDEYYAWGLRNPWGMSFDDGRFFVADVGQDRLEEVNLVESGGNYGWNVREGRTCFDASDPSAVPEECPDETPGDVRGGEPLLDPIIEYPNGEPSSNGLAGVAVVGGHVYRGSAVPELEGAYVFGDLQPGGRLFVGRPPEDGERWATATVELADEAPEQLLAFGRDDEGEVYVLGGNAVRRIVPAE